MWREVRDGSVYMGRKIRGVEADKDARRQIHFSNVMGRDRRPSEAKKWTKENRAAEDVQKKDLFLDRHRRGTGHRGGGRDIWLSDPGDRFGGAFEEEVENELERRELTKGTCPCSLNVPIKWALML